MPKAFEYWTFTMCYECGKKYENKWGWWIIIIIIIWVLLQLASVICNAFSPFGSPFEETEGECRKNCQNLRLYLANSECACHLKHFIPLFNQMMRTNDH